MKLFSIIFSLFVGAIIIGFPKTLRAPVPTFLDRQEKKYTFFPLLKQSTSPIVKVVRDVRPKTNLSAILKKYDIPSESVDYKELPENYESCVFCFYDSDSLIVKKSINILNNNIAANVRIGVRSDKIISIKDSKDDFKIDGFTCEGNRVYFRDNQLCECRLIEDYHGKKYSIPKFNWVYVLNGKVHSFGGKYNPDYSYEQSILYSVNDSSGEINKLDTDKKYYIPCDSNKPAKLYTCPENTKGREVSNYYFEQMLNLLCCDSKSSTESTCYKSGPERILLIDNLTFDQSRFREINFEKNVKNGQYREWTLNEEKISVEGNYLNDKPIGDWKILNKSQTDYYHIKYNNDQELVSISLPDHSYVVTPILVQKPLDNKPAIMVGYDRLEISMPYISRYQIKNRFVSPVVFYSTWDKKETVGIAVEDYRFYSSNICDSRCDTIPGDDTGRYWEVYEHKNGMCLAYMSTKTNIEIREGQKNQYYKVWYECPNFIDNMDYYKNGSYVVKSDGEIYDKPDGQKKIFAFDTYYNINLDIKESKKINGKIWFKSNLSYEIYNNKTEASTTVEVGEWWVPLYVGDKLNISENNIRD